MVAYELSGRLETAVSELGVRLTNLRWPAVLDYQFKGVIATLLPDEVVDDSTFRTKPVPGFVLGTVTAAVKKTTGFGRAVGGNQWDAGSNKTVSEVVLTLDLSRRETHGHGSSGKRDGFKLAEDLGAFFGFFEKLASANSNCNSP